MECPYLPARQRRYQVVWYGWLGAIVVWEVVCARIAWNSVSMRGEIKTCIDLFLVLFYP